MKNNKKKNEMNQVEENSFDLYQEYNNLKEDENLVSFRQLCATALIKNNLGFDDERYLQFVENVNDALRRRIDLVFDNLVITFKINERYSLMQLAPYVSKTQNPNVPALTLKSKMGTDFDVFYNTLNLEINRLLSSGSLLELVPNTIIYFDFKTNNMVLLFDHSLVSDIKG
ncbi:MSC_0623 family F1-like ATPase-associated protein [Ureaplasma canigenitalium]|uniref:MSC_0623 family F1-like ATPase-associated protein n=1 Tax=Ureaplasma canigenitalium TaxID=42092 RepID=UPI0004E0E478|nr:DUF2714 domain-containing protein [Ureaplasma canigenitalium]